MVLKTKFRLNNLQQNNRKSRLKLNYRINRKLRNKPKIFKNNKRGHYFLAKIFQIKINQITRLKLIVIKEKSHKKRNSIQCLLKKIKIKNLLFLFKVKFYLSKSREILNQNFNLIFLSTQIIINKRANFKLYNPTNKKIKKFHPKMTKMTFPLV